MDVLTALYRREKITLPVSEVTHFKAEDKYVTAYHANGELILSDTLETLEQALAADFLRISRSFLIRRQLLTGIAKDSRGHYAVTNLTQQRLSIPRRRVSAVRSHLQQQSA